MEIALSRVIKAPQEDAFKAWTDYENMPRWSKIMKTVKVISRMNNTLKHNNLHQHPRGNKGRLVYGL